ncbi:ATP-binding protein [Desulfosarcina sp.]|uniref:ATP-binding protein n=1 Tax=Desulfosarcina sp. TaxID=2027861 RepID=UPI0029ADCF92|nr:ATP-binding protein [Desulfosarcina sp.]MDX2454857.1 ATP-binding protein [Desulfosarcina sp.]
MVTIAKPNPELNEKLTVNIAIVGGGRACNFFLTILQADTLPFLKVNLVGVCDIDPKAEGLLTAKKMGIFTTSDFRDFFSIDNLDSILELTNRRQVLLELIRLRPKRVGILEHNIGRFLRNYFQMNQQLKSAEHRAVLAKMVSDFIIQHSNAAIAVINTDFTIAQANEAYLKTVKRPRSEVIGRYCYQVYYNQNAPCASSQQALKCPMLETLKTGRTAHVIHERGASTGHATYENIVTYPLKDEFGEVTHVIEIWRDITADLTTRWEKQARNLRNDLQRMVQEDRMISLGKLAASCVHEINNPIQGLLTYAELMRKMTTEEKPDDDNWKQLNGYLNIVSDELVRCGNIVAGLLSFSREASRGYVDLDLNDVLKAVTALTRHKMELQNILLKLELVQEIMMVRGDTNQLQQAMLNLIFNAIEAMPTGGELAITTRADASAGQVVIEVQDTGTGILEKDLDHIYDPFFTTKAPGEGTGLGLSIVYGIIKNHGGQVKVKSAVDTGTVFSLRLPLV